MQDMCIFSIRVVRESLNRRGERVSGERVRSTQLSRGRESQAEEAAGTKALRWKHTAEFEGLPGSHSGSSGGGRGKTRPIKLRPGRVRVDHVGPYRPLQ